MWKKAVHLITLLSLSCLPFFHLTHPIHGRSGVIEIAIFTLTCFLFTATAERESARNCALLNGAREKGWKNKRLELECCYFIRAVSSESHRDRGKKNVRVRVLNSSQAHRRCCPRQGRPPLTHLVIHSFAIESALHHLLMCDQLTGQRRSRDCLLSCAVYRKNDAIHRLRIFHVRSTDFVGECSLTREMTK